MPKEFEFIFLGGIFSESQTDFILKNSKGVVQNAADVLQKNFIRGLDSNSRSRVTLVNLPFVASYPRGFKRFFYPGSAEWFDGRVKLFGCWFLNFFILNYFSRFFSAIRCLCKVAGSGNYILFVYSAHLPFIFAALFSRFINPGLKICLIIPDLPEYMGGAGVAHFLFGKVNAGLFYRYVKKFDYFVVLTKDMISRLGVCESKTVVVEGIVESSKAEAGATAEFISEGCVKSFLYSGTLAARYGVRDLVDAFELLSEKDIELWICGDGDSKEYIQCAALRDPRIRYFGQVERGDVLKLQRRATFLVNPRRPEGEYTKYSFPSKVLEYMASARPVVMYQLDGIPDEYTPYFISPPSVGVEGLAKCFDRLLTMNSHELDKFGRDAQQFVFDNKNSQCQVKKIFDVIFGESLC